MSFYAVRRGHRIGVFDTWSECERQVNGFSGALHKKFATREAASAWITNPSQVPLKRPRPVNLKPKVKSSIAFEITDKSAVVAFTDGSAINNGHANARAGVGVFFGENDPRNLSERLDPREYRQTNQVRRFQFFSFVFSLRLFLFRWPRS
jgi:ribonuclease HI